MSHAPTIYEDWTQRRAVLAAHAPPADEGPHGRAQAHIHVLDFLLVHYRDDPRAHQPARFPKPTGLLLNTRTLVVHHHLGRGKVHAIKKKEEASKRASRILRKIKDLDPQASAGAPGGGAILHRNDYMYNLPHKIVSVPHLFLLCRPNRLDDITWTQAKESYRCYDYSLKQALLKLIYLYLIGKKSVIECGEDRIRIRSRVLEIIEDPEAINAVHLAWLDNFAETQDLLGRCEEIFRLPFYRPYAVELMRGKLAHHDAAVRQRAARMLWYIGDLHDIGLLEDLLDLPTQHDETAGERAHLERTLAILSGREEAPPFEAPTAEIGSRSDNSEYESEDNPAAHDEA